MPIDNSNNLGLQFNRETIADLNESGSGDMLSVPLSPSDSGKNIKLNHRDRPRSNLSVNVHSKNSGEEWDANKDSSARSISSLNTEDQAKLDRFAIRFKDLVFGK